MQKESLSSNMSRSSMVKAPKKYVIDGMISLE